MVIFQRKRVFDIDFENAMMMIPILIQHSQPFFQHYQKMQTLIQKFKGRVYRSFT
jgi:hypothetical protein